MAVTLIGSDGLFTRLGKMATVAIYVNVQRSAGGPGRIPEEINDVFVEFDGASNDLRDGIKGLLDAVTAHERAGNQIQTALRTAASNTLIQMVKDDDPLSANTVEEAIKELIEQMTASAHYVDANAVGSSVAASGNDGDGAVEVSTKDGRGRTLENALAEDIRVIVTSATTAGSEKLSAAGEASEHSDKMDRQFPSGSSAAKTYTAKDAASATANELTNGTFDAFTTNAPDDWDIDTGAAGTQILEETTTTYKGGVCLEYTETSGSVLTAISQDLSSAGLKSLTPYGINLWTAITASLVAGELTIDLYDGSAVIADEEGTDNELVIDLTAESTAFANHSATFRLPEPLPATITLRVRLTTALTAGESVYIDHLCLAEAAQLYAGGPFITFFSGATDWSLDDELEITVTNDRASQWQETFDEFFNMTALGLLLPVSGSTLVNDSLIA